MLITNLKSSRRDLYEDLISRLSNKEDFYISDKAYDIFDNEVEGLISVHCRVEGQDLTEFWNVYHAIRDKYKKWCITTNSLNGRDTVYLGWQNPAWDEDGYFWTSKEIIREIMDKNNTKEHPFIFNSRYAAIRHLKTLNILQKCRVVEWY